MTKQKVHVYTNPFPHLIVEEMYDQDELSLIWEELNFLTKPGKLWDPEKYQASPSSNGKYQTESKAVILDFLYSERSTSNILEINRKLFNGPYRKIFSEIAPHCVLAIRTNYDITKIRYYHDKDYYEPHVDTTFDFVSFTYFHKNPKKFSGGELFFPEYNYKFECNDNCMILIPSYVEHEVKKVSIKNSDYYDGWGRYCMTQFFASVPAYLLKK